MSSKTRPAVSTGSKTFPPTFTVFSMASVEKKTNTLDKNQEPKQNYALQQRKGRYKDLFSFVF